MTDSLDLFWRTLVIGVAVAAPVGAMAVLIVQRTLARGWGAGIVTGGGIATADALYAGAAAFGVAAVSQSLVALQTPLRIAGGLGLLWLGWRAFQSKPSAAGEDSAVEQSVAGESVAAQSHAGESVAGSSAGSEPTAGQLSNPAVARTQSGRMFTSAFALTLTNPMTIMAFAAIFASAGLVAQPGMSNALVATAGVAVGSFGWWLFLVTVVWTARHALSANFIDTANRASGIVLMAFGILALIAGVFGA